MTIVQNELSYYEKFSKLFSSNFEHKITNTDTIILEIDSELYELNNIIDTENNLIEFKYYSYGYYSNIFPKSISNNNNLKFYLKFIEPTYEQIKTQYYILDFTNIFIKYGNFIKDASNYNITYKNIFTNNIDFAIMKVKYNGEITSKYIIAYNSEYINKEIIFIILKKIFSIVKK